MSTLPAAAQNRLRTMSTSSKDSNPEVRRYLRSSDHITAKPSCYYGPPSALPHIACASCQTFDVPRKPLTLLQLSATSRPWAVTHTVFDPTRGMIAGGPRRGAGGSARVRRESAQLHPACDTTGALSCRIHPCKSPR